MIAFPHPSFFESNIEAILFIHFDITY